MDFTFSLGWMFGGIGIILAGGLVVIFYRQIAENLANGVSSYEKVKLFGIITIVIGFLVATNLFSFVMTALIRLLFNRG
ncbi:hypothetical protein IKF02_01665 [Candidatus Saccharibacteria bacterium]|nr:hypothetical protein [Candidatus Saccharibacteria bacterium]